MRQNGSQRAAYEVMNSERSRYACQGLLPGCSLKRPSPPCVKKCCLSVLQHGPRVSLGCRSNEFLDHAKT
jgi:hypothetical protein